MAVHAATPNVRWNTAFKLRFRVKFSRRVLRPPQGNLDWKVANCPPVFAIEK